MRDFGGGQGEVRNFPALRRILLEVSGVRGHHGCYRKCRDHGDGRQRVGGSVFDLLLDGGSVSDLLLDGCRQGLLREYRVGPGQCLRHPRARRKLQRRCGRRWPLLHGQPRDRDHRSLEEHHLHGCFHGRRCQQHHRPDPHEADEREHEGSLRCRARQDGHPDRLWQHRHDKGHRHWQRHQRRQRHPLRLPRRVPALGPAPPPLLPAARVSARSARAFGRPGAKGRRSVGPRQEPHSIVSLRINFVFV
mmetsp:Transcript_79220/g.256807  ORF Transcript_79220/g.256807 Transcript_79220/m.256807 type:complete len:248 (-) Transcript_79220:322-1065(-)